MAGNMSDYLENKVLDIVFNKDTIAEITVYTGLCTDTPSEATGCVEPTAASYINNGRQKTDENTWGAAGSGWLHNDLTIEFTTATESWCTIGGFGCWDATVAGNLLFWGVLGTAKDVSTGESCKFAPEALEISLN